MIMVVATAVISSDKHGLNGSFHLWFQRICVFPHTLGCFLERSSFLTRIFELQVDFAIGSRHVILALVPHVAGFLFLISFLMSRIFRRTSNPWRQFVTLQLLMSEFSDDAHIRYSLDLLSAAAILSREISEFN